MSEAEILKLAFSEFFIRNVKKQLSLQNISKTGRENFKKWLKENTTKNIEDLTDEQAYNIIKNA